MQRNGQYLDVGNIATDNVPDTAVGIGGARRHVQDRSDGAGASLAGKIYAAPSATDALSQDARYGDKANNVENIYLPAADQAVAAKGFLSEMKSWWKGL